MTCSQLDYCHFFFYIYTYLHIYLIRRHVSPVNWIWNLLYSHFNPLLLSLGLGALDNCPWLHLFWVCFWWFIVQCSFIIWASFQKRASTFVWISSRSSHWQGMICCWDFTKPATENGSLSYGASLYVHTAESIINYFFFSFSFYKIL